MKTDRLLALTIYLMNHGKTSASKLTKEYEVSSRTIIRDMDTLDRSGIHICSTPEINGDLGIVENCVLDKQAPVQVDFGVASEDSSMNEKIHILEQAINQNKKVQFLYKNSQDEEKQFIIEPVGVEFKRYSWYMNGYYEKHQANCKFELIRMQDLVITSMINIRENDDIN